MYPTLLTGEDDPSNCFLRNFVQSEYYHCIMIPTLTVVTALCFCLAVWLKRILGTDLQGSVQYSTRWGGSVGRWARMESRFLYKQASAPEANKSTEAEDWGKLSRIYSSKFELPKCERQRGLCCPGARDPCLNINIAEKRSRSMCCSVDHYD